MATKKKMKEVLRNLAKVLDGLSGSFPDSFDKAIKLLNSCKGNIVVIAYGKSAHIGSKLVSTFRSAGRKAYLLDPVDAFYGEAASVSGKDTSVIISSGESDEIMRIIPWLKKKNARIISITPSGRSSLARASDVVLKTAMPADAADGMASYTTSITSLALGDLLGLSMLYDQDVEKERASSAGSSDEALYTIEDLLSTRPGNPYVPWDTPFRDALIELTSRGLGAISIVDDKGKIEGIITDGDVRRLLQKSQGSLARIFLTNVETVMTKNPKRLTPSKSLSEAINIMEDNAITVLPVVDDNEKPVGMVHLHDLVQLGILRKKPEGKVKNKSIRANKKPKRKSGRK